MKDNRLGIITFPVTNSVALSNLIEILYSLYNKLNLITGDAGYSFFINSEKVHAYRVEHSANVHRVFFRILNYAWTQVKITNKLFRVGNDIDIWIFFVGAEGLLLPILIAKLLRKKVIIVSAGSGSKSAKAANDTLSSSLALLQACTYHLSDRIILYSKTIIEEHGLQNYKDKIYIAHEHFLDFAEFKKYKQLNYRDNLVSYIGRFSEEKGTLNLIKAIPEMLKNMHDVNFLIGGDGQLKGEIEIYLNENSLNDKVVLPGWISHNDLPRYLNDLKLLVLPSYTEGLPNIMLEAMACGTPVLAAPVGAIPDYIKDGETGFIMENNSPECIAENIMRALNHPDLERIADNAHLLVEKEFTFEKAVERYREILENL